MKKIFNFIKGLFAQIFIAVMLLFFAIGAIRVLYYFGRLLLGFLMIEIP